MKTMYQGKKWYDRYDKATYNLYFDGMKEAEGKGSDYARNFIAKRISRQAGINYDPFLPLKYLPALERKWLKWNRDPQCPPQEWQKNENIEPDSGLILTGLAVLRHNNFAYTLNNVNYITLIFLKDNHINLAKGLWLIEHDVDFAYAILNYSMFKAWCALTANMPYEEPAGTKHQGLGHFAAVMWDTFPIQDTKQRLSQLKLSSDVQGLFSGNPTVEEAITHLGTWLKFGWPSSYPDFDDCMDELCGFGQLPFDFETLLRLSLSKVSIKPWYSTEIVEVGERLKNKEWEKLVSKSSILKLIFDEFIDAFCGFGNLSNIRLSELPDPLTEEEENLIQGSKEPPISVRKAIERVGDFQMNGWKKKGPRGNYCKTMPSSVSFEGYMNKLGSLSLVKYSLRLQILAQGFLDAFYGKVPLILP